MQGRLRGGRPPEPKQNTRKTWRERIEEIQIVYNNIPKSFKLIWQADWRISVGMALVTLLAAALPVSQAWVGKMIVDGVVQAINGGLQVEEGLRHILPYLLAEFGLIMLGAALGQIRNLLEHVLNSRLSHYINNAIIRKSLTLDLRFFEDAQFYDKLQNARREADSRALMIINGGFMLVQNLIILLSFAVALFSFNWIIGLILFGATIPTFIAQTRYSGLNFRLLTWRAPEARRMQYFEHMLTVDSSAKEIKLFGLGNYLLDRYNELFWKFFKEDTNLARRRSLISLLWGLLATASYYASYAWIIAETIGGAITLGSMTFYLTVFRQSQNTFQSLFNGVGRLYESGLFMDNLFSFLNLTPQMARPENPAPMPTKIKYGIEFRNVSFRYPDRQDWALRNVNLHIKPGEKIALVGANGAGKTTLIKLLTRLYDPTEGQILLDGVDLRDFDPDELRDHIGVIFQDFVRFQNTAGENIGFGQVKALEDKERIADASERGGSNDVIAELPNGFDTMLGRWFEKGHELSGGQWQKIALARAFMRDSEVLVLDEPTSALDAAREYEIFQRFRELTEGKIAVLISHRFSTVRMADRIAVIENGTIGELGSHEELLALNGTYARLFNMQAEGYR
jgi:ABC-type multidrug transport system, ATPase and permease components